MHTYAKVMEKGNEYHLIIPKSKIKILGEEVYIKIEALKKKVREKEEMELESLVSYGLGKGAFHGPEVTALLKLYGTGAMGQLSKEKIKFSKEEMHKLKELVTHPSKPVREKDKRYYLTKLGVEMTEGIIIALKNLESESKET